MRINMPPGATLLFDSDQYVPGLSRLAEPLSICSLGRSFNDKAVASIFVSVTGFGW